MRRFTTQCFLWALLLLAAGSQRAVSQTDARMPRAKGGTVAKAGVAEKVKKATEATGKTAYGVLAYDETDIYYADGLVTFPLTGGSTFGHVRLFGNATYCVTAGAYADGYYYMARATTVDGKNYAADLLKYDIDGDSLSTVGTLDGFAYYVADMTYDNATNTMYAVERPENDGTSDLRSIDLTTGVSVKVADLDRRFFTLACTYAGQLYGVSFEGELCKIDKATGAVTLIGSTGMSPNYFQSMEFDHDSETLYWTYVDQLQGSGVATVDTVAGTATILGTLGDGAEIAGLYIPFSASAPGTPAAVSDLTVTPDAEGKCQATVTWTNPTLTYDGETLNDITDVKVYRDKKLIKTFAATDAKPGQTMTYTDTMEETALGAWHTYIVVASNATGEGAESKTKAYVGKDILSAVQNVSLSITDYTTAVLTWDACESGVSGGYVDKSTVTYKITRNPDGVVLAENLKECTFTDNTIEKVGKYTYTVQAMNADSQSETSTSEAKVIGPVYTIPYSFDFTDADAPDSWTIVDGNNDGYTWIWGKNASGEQIMGHQGSNVSMSQDYLMSHYLAFEAGKKYRLDYTLHCYTNDQLYLQLVKECNQNKSAQYLTYTSIEGTTDFVRHTMMFTAQSTGNFNFAIGAFSPINSGWMELSSVSIKEADKVEIAASTIDGEKSPTAGKEATYTIGVQNFGSDDITNYVVTLKDTDGNTLVTEEVNTLLASGKDAQVKVTWTPQDQLVTGVMAEVSCEGDADLTNNATSTMAVEVRPAFKGKVVSIGTTSTKTNKSYPFDLYNQHAAVFNLYSADEIGMSSASIVKVGYPYEAKYLSKDAQDVPVKVYMGNTDLTTTAGGWIPESDLTLVYDSTINIAKGSEGELEIELTNPFEYDGHNLGVITVVECGTYYNYVYFTQYTSPLEGNAAYAWSNYSSKTAFDFTQTGKQNYYGYTSSIILYATQTSSIGKVDVRPASVAYDLYDMAGRKVSEGVTTVNGTVEQGKVAPGVYVMTYVKDGKRHSMKTIVKK